MKRTDSVKKLLPLLAVGLIALTSCTTPVSKLKTDQQLEELGGNASAWEAEQRELNGEFSTFQDGIPIFSGLFGETYRASTMLDDVAGPLTDNDNLVMSMDGFFRYSYGVDDLDQVQGIDQSMAVSDGLAQPGNYEAYFACEGVGKATLEVHLSDDPAEFATQSSLALPISCSDPVSVRHGEFSIPRGGYSLSTFVSADSKTLGSYEFRIYSSTEGE